MIVGGVVIMKNLNQNKAARILAVFCLFYLKFSKI